MQATAEISRNRVARAKSAAAIVTFAACGDFWDSLGVGETSGAGGTTSSAASAGETTSGAASAGETPSTHNHTYGEWMATGGPNTEEERSCVCGDKQIRVTGTPEGLRFFTYTGNPSLVVGKSTTGPAPTGVLRIPAYRRLNASAAYQPVLTIGTSTQGFQNCTALTSVIIPDSVTNIRTEAFEGCTSLKSVTIGNGVQTIGDRTFYNCTALTSVTIGNGVQTIGERAFRYCTALTSVVIPNSVTIIRKGAFSECTALTSAAIGNDVKNIENGGAYDGVFQNCTVLTSVTIGSSVTNIGWNAFKDCKALTIVTIPNSVKTIGFSAFEGCTKLASVNLGSGVANLHDSAFSDCSALTSIHIPASVTNMVDVSTGNGVFIGCDKLASITVDPASQHYSIQDKILYDKAKTVLCKAPPAAGITSYNIPGSVQRILEGAFYNCTALTSVTIPAGVTNIYHAAFFGCYPALTSVRVLATTPPTAGPFMFARDSNDTPNLRIRVPSASVAAYKAAAYWSPYASVIAADL